MSSLQKHWDKSSSTPIPHWSEAWIFLDELPNNTMGGCYAFAKDDEIKYIGVALNKGLDGYMNHSLGTRISSYWRVNRDIPMSNGKTTYIPSENLKKEGIKALYTIGFPGDQNYLAIALELYLIRKMKPIMNKVYNTIQIEAAPGIW